MKEPQTFHTVSEMLIVYETNREKIKKFDEETYLNHHKMVKTILCKLFKKVNLNNNRFLEIFNQI